MIRKSFILLLLILHLTNVYAQEQTWDISGTMLMEEEPLSFAVIQLLNATDSTTLSIEMSDEDGNFKFVEIANGDYLISINSINFTGFFPERFQVKDGPLDLVNLILPLQSIVADAVEIKAKRKVIQRNSDHLEVSIKDSYLGTSGLGMEDLISILPTVQYKNKEIKINNVGDPLILIDGKGNKYSNQKNMQRILMMLPNEIDKIEIYTNPPARFDADGGAVINIVTFKRSMISTVSTSLSQGFLQDTDPSNRQSLFANLNFNLGFIKSYVDLGIGNSRSNQKGEVEYIYPLQDLSISGDSDFFTEDKYLSHTLGIIMDPTEKDQILFEFDTYYSIDDPLKTRTTRNINFLTTSTGILDSIWNEDILDNRVYNNKVYSFGYWHKGKTKLNIQGSLTNNSNTNNKDFVIESNNSISSSINDMDSNFKTVLITSNIEFPISTFNFSAGAKFIGMNYNQENLSTVSDLTYFAYEENIGSAYLEFSGKSFDISWKLGLRDEFTSWKAMTGQDNKLFDKDNYNTLFPSIFISKNFPKTSWSLSYSRRISRPFVSEFNPNRIISSNSLNLQEGNIQQLLPKLYNNYSLGFNYNSLAVDLSISKLNNQRVLFPIETDGTTVIYSPISIGNEVSYGGSISERLHINNILLNLSANIYYVDATIEDGIKAGGMETSFNIFMNANLHKNLKGSIAMNYILPYSYGYTSVSEIISMNLGFRYAKQNSPFTFSLRLIDPLGINQFAFESTFDNYLSRDSAISNSRAVSVNISYRFDLTHEFNKEYIKSDDVNMRGK